MCNTGRIFNIQRFSTFDGPGIRTVVFMKGCPLRCVWCHNPEAGSMATEIFYKPELCIGCGGCMSVCPQNCHAFKDGQHHYDRKNCVLCERCTQLCHVNALEACGRKMSVDEVVDIVLRDKPFYDESGGGVTLSGGEPLMQYDFSVALLKALKAQGIHTAIETSGFFHGDLSVINSYTDLWLYDIKLFLEEEHIKYTGVSNKNILENLHFLDQTGVKIILRCPIIPDVNMNNVHFEKLAALSNRLKHIVAVHLEPYHPLGISKAKQLGKIQSYGNDKFLDIALLEPYVEYMREKTDVDVVII